jgi:hypothetical protein
MQQKVSFNTIDLVVANAQYKKLYYGLYAFYVHNV